MSDIPAILSDEIKKQNLILQRAKIELKNAPTGFIRFRNRKDSMSIYHVIDNMEVNITENPEIINALIRKRINNKSKKTATANIAVLKKALANFQPNSFEDIIKALPKVYYKANKFLNNTAKSTQNMLLYSPETHKHTTTSGIFVRSKSEVIIANALTSYGIPFSYEEMFPVATSRGKRVYPDFKIVCSDGYIIIWEHWGLLSNIDYCTNQVGKLNLYQSQNYIINENLIVTMDDCNGGCNAQKIDEIIRTLILPHMGF